MAPAEVGNCRFRFYLAYLLTRLSGVLSGLSFFLFWRIFWLWRIFWNFVLRCNRHSFWQSLWRVLWLSFYVAYLLAYFGRRFSVWNIFWLLLASSGVALFDTACGNTVLATIVAQKGFVAGSFRVVVDEAASEHLYQQDAPGRG